MHVFVGDEFVDDEARIGIVRDVRVSDSTFAEAAAAFPPREIVELLLAIGFYMLMARLMETAEMFKIDNFTQKPRIVIFNTCQRLIWKAHGNNSSTSAPAGTRPRMDFSDEGTALYLLHRPVRPPISP